MSNSFNGRKVAVIGCGFVGSTTAYSLMESKLFTDMVLIDVDTNRAEGEALDISHGIPLLQSHEHLRWHLRRSFRCLHRYHHRWR